MKQVPPTALVTPDQQPLPHNQLSQLTPQQVIEHHTQTLEDISRPTWLNATSPSPSSHASSAPAAALVQSEPLYRPSILASSLSSQSPPLSSTSCADESDDSSKEESDSSGVPKHDTLPPTHDDVHKALENIGDVLRPPQRNQPGHKHFEGDSGLQRRLEMMEMLFLRYNNGVPWIAASEQVSEFWGSGKSHAKVLQHWARDFIVDPHQLPYQAYGTWKTSLLDNEDLRTDLCTYLQSVGKYVHAQDIVDYL